MLQAQSFGAGALVAYRFRVERALGRGGSGEVHAAYDLLHQRPVALKLLRTDRIEPDLEEGLRGEFRTLRALDHPGIVQVFDFGRADGVPFYTMELLPGGDLAALLTALGALEEPMARLCTSSSSWLGLYCIGLIGFGLD